MSGPIVRRYGFPNFDRIFGKKEPPHGVDEPEAPPVDERPAATAADGPTDPAPKTDPAAGK